MNEMVSKLTSKFRLCTDVTVCADSKVFMATEMKDFANGEAESTDKDATVFPMIFAIEQGNTSYLITVYDLPGEAYSDDESKSIKLAKHEGIRTVDGAILMVDACQLYQSAMVKTINAEVIDDTDPEKKTVIKQVEVTYAKHDDDIVAPLKYMSTYQIGANLQHLAIVVTKADLLIGKHGKAFGADSAAVLGSQYICKSDESEQHFENVSMRVINKVDNEVMAAINEAPLYTRRPDIKQEICGKFSGNSLRPENVKAFTISTLCRPDSGSTDFLVCDNAGYTRHRVLEPMLYFMARWGMVNIAVDNVVPEPEPDPKPGIFARLFGRKKDKDAE